MVESRNMWGQNGPRADGPVGPVLRDVALSVGAEAESSVSGHMAADTENIPVAATLDQPVWPGGGLGEGKQVMQAVVVSPAIEVFRAAQHDLLTGGSDSALYDSHEMPALQPAVRPGV